MDPVLTEVNQKIQSALLHLKSELSSIRAGRANPSLIENITVEAYGGKMKLMEVGTISTPQPSLLMVQVWDVSVMPSVVKALQEANLGLNPANDGTTIRLPIPPLTEERREEFIKLAHQKMESCRVVIRQIRHDIRQGWEKDMEAGPPAGGFGEDEIKRREKMLQELVDKAIAEVDNLGKIKEEELREI